MHKPRQLGRPDGLLFWRVSLCIYTSLINAIIRCNSPVPYKNCNSVDHPKMSNDANGIASDTSYTKIYGHADLEQFMTRLPVKLQFIAVLSNISFTGDDIFLDFQFFKEVPMKGIRVVIASHCDHSRRNAFVVMRMLARSLGLDLPTERNKPWNMENIHLSQLCIAHVFVQVVARDGVAELLLEDIAPIDLAVASQSANRYRLTHKETEGWTQMALYRLFKYLVGYDIWHGHLFKYAAITNNNPTLDQFVNEMRKKMEQMWKDKHNPPKRQRVPVLPIYKGFETQASQDDFNSQAMETQEPQSSGAAVAARTQTSFAYPYIHSAEINSLGDNYKAPTQSQAVRQSQPVKRDWMEMREEDVVVQSSDDPSAPSAPWEAKEFAYLELNEPKKIEARCVAKLDHGHESDLFWVTIEDAEEHKDEEYGMVLLPLQNCIVTTVMKHTADDLKINIDSTLNLVATKYMFAPNIPTSKVYTLQMEPQALQSIKQVEPRQKLSLKKAYFTLPAPRDPFVQFKDLQLKQGDVRYVHMVCLMTNAFKEFHHNYVDLEFTDFTANLFPHKRVISNKFLGRGMTLPESSSFRAIMYVNQLEDFNRAVTKAFDGKDIVALADDSHSDLARYGIVCDIVFKVDVYNDRYTFIARECALVPRKEVEAGFWYKNAEAVACLHGLYRNMLQFVEDSDIQIGRNPAVLHGLTRSLPFKSDASQPAGVRLEIPADEIAGEAKLEPVPPPQTKPHMPELIPNLNAGTHHFAIEDVTAQFNTLNDIETSADNKTLYLLKQLRLLGTRSLGETLVLLVTNDLVSHEEVQPNRVLPLYITKKHNLAYFAGGKVPQDQGQLSTELGRALEPLIGQTFNFQVQPGYIALSDGASQAVWCPVECTLEELRAQAAQTLLNATTDAAAVGVKMESQY